MSVNLRQVVEVIKWYTAVKVIKIYLEMYMFIFNSTDTILYVMNIISTYIAVII